MGLLIFPELIYQLLFWVVESFQAGGLPILFVAMILQALAIPIPSEFVLICGGAAFGLLSGWLVGALGSVVAAFISFYISRKGGRSVAIRFVGERGIEFADNWFNHWGVWAVLLGRIAPFIPFDVISYSAGLTQMKSRSFMIPTVIGTLPRALFYAFLGDCFSVTLTELIQYYPEVPPELEGTMFMFNIILFTIVIVMASILIVYWFVTRRYAARKETKSI
ncbi:VTT domain-containing protein [Candidatus Bathyarchaeota archaeon]|nr:VTT domain-containing protein [Candidatus Bathyarchaeota archaeon]